MNAWTVTLQCPNCDGTEFTPVAPPNIRRQEATASHQCDTCRKEWAIRVQIANVPTIAAVRQARARAR